MHFDVQLVRVRGRGSEQLDKVVARKPSPLQAIGVDGASGESDVTIILEDALPVLMPKQVKARTASYRVFDIILIHEPVWRVMAENQVDYIVDRVEHGLEWA